MKPKRRKRTVRIAADLAAGMLTRLPDPCPLDPAVLLGALWPVAVRLERLEHSGTAKAAGEYRRLRKKAWAETDRLIAAQDSAPASLPALRATVPFLAPHWRIGLTPGVPAVLLRDRGVA